MVAKAATPAARAVARPGVARPRVTARPSVVARPSVAARPTVVGAGGDRSRSGEATHPASVAAKVAAPTNTATDAVPAPPTGPARPCRRPGPRQVKVTTHPPSVTAAAPADG